MKNLNDYYKIRDLFTAVDRLIENKLAGRCDRSLRDLIETIPELKDDLENIKRKMESKFWRQLYTIEMALNEQGFTLEGADNECWGKLSPISFIGKLDGVSDESQ